MHSKIFSTPRRPDFSFHIHIPGKTARQFVRDYALPLTITLIFLLLVLAVTFLRASQRSSLGDLLVGVTEQGKGYGTLLSTDKAEELIKNDDTAQPATAVPPGSPASFAINPNPPGSSAPTVVSSPAAGGPAVAAAVFGASIAYFNHDSTELVCTLPKAHKQWCSKKYSFAGGVRTQNGPGTVRYSWRSSLPDAVQDGSFSAAAGESVTSLPKVITLECSKASSYSLQLVLVSPASTQSNVINIKHNCDEI